MGGLSGVVEFVVETETLVSLFVGTISQNVHGGMAPSLSILSQVAR